MVVIGAAASIIGQIPVVVAGGVAMKFTKAALGNGTKTSKRKTNKRKSRSQYNKYSPI